MPFRDLLRHDLAEARRTGNSEAVSLIRSLISAIDNAEAIDPADAGGVTEVSRRRLSNSEIVDVIVDEAAELRQAAEDYERRGQGEEARRLRALAQVVDRYAERVATDDT